MKRKTSYTTGIAAEALCRLALRLKFYRILASRYRSPFGEIDIVAMRRKTVALVEVKARPTQSAVAESVTPRQRERLARGARDFLSRHPKLSRHDIRFDVMLVAPKRWPAPIKDAWRLDA